MPFGGKSREIFKEINAVDMLDNDNVFFRYRTRSQGNFNKKIQGAMV